MALKPLIRNCTEVVARTAKPDKLLKYRRDTIWPFKVPPINRGFIKKLPGVEVRRTDAAQGEVGQVTVDGKHFWRRPKMAATKNLRTDAIKKMQIYNESKTEQNKLTGIGRRQEKSMNLELKEDAKKGGFGR
jgi:hypothetical protein